MAVPEPRPQTARPRALLVENIHADARQLLTEAGWQVDTAAGALDEAELISRLDGVQLLGIRSQTQVTAAVLDAAPDLRAVGAFCIGTNQVDLFSAAAHGVAVFNAPYSNTRSVVELALAEIIALTRRLTVKNDLMHEGVWDKSAVGAHEVRGRRLGIIGYGNIGSQLSVVAEALGMSVFFYDTVDKLAMGNARRCGSLTEVLDLADVVTLHVDGRASNAGFFGETEFARMRPGSIFLNLSRGFLVDDVALRRHIESGHIAGAALDVFPQEPKGRGETFQSVLRGLDNVILTPHVGGSTEEAQEDIGRFVAAKLRDYALHGATTLSVNLPTLNTETVPGRVRLAHLHHNVPGVLAAINKVLADEGVNIEGQQLATLGDLGYVVTDIAHPATEDVGRRLRELPQTVRVRQLL
ncbi:phosphoglycerate dehydrogenase [Kineococcus gynurae]|uniref:D-3-phosphoglycerate dehydrogenase n=1 Tax=Kineococcus gynurae TaxID=452979 RepID=A0ABV5LV75_9ACTN